MTISFAKFRAKKSPNWRGVHVPDTSMYVDAFMDTIPPAVEELEKKIPPCSRKQVYV